VAHILARLRRVKAEDIKEVLRADAARHAEQGLHLEHLWQNVDDPEEVFFLFRADNLTRAKRFVEEVHTHALNDDPHISIPRMVFMEEK
jgi:hypothetical protein